MLGRLRSGVLPAPDDVFEDVDPLVPQHRLLLEGDDAEEQSARALFSASAPNAAACMPRARAARRARASHSRARASQVMQWLVHGSWGEELFYQSFFIYGCGGEFGTEPQVGRSWCEEGTRA